MNPLKIISVANLFIIILRTHFAVEYSNGFLNPWTGGELCGLGRPLSLDEARLLFMGPNNEGARSIWNAVGFV